MYCIIYFKVLTGEICHLCHLSPSFKHISVHSVLEIFLFVLFFTAVNLLENISLCICGLIWK
uniref:Uncharacterized protein n=1 Tax=Poecilia reticulata TaxID=8081 RepID=A0A3P9NFM8_POERE